MTHNLKWTCNPVQMTLHGSEGIPPAIAATTSLGVSKGHLASSYLEGSDLLVLDLPYF